VRCPATRTKSTNADAAARKFDCLLVWKLDRFGHSLVDCLSNIRDLERSGIRFIARYGRLFAQLEVNVQYQSNTRVTTAEYSALVPLALTVS
jgi:hypothetical protein